MNRFVKTVRLSASSGPVRLGREKVAVSAKVREMKEENQLEKYVFETYELLSGEKTLGKRLEIVNNPVN